MVVCVSLFQGTDAGVRKWIDRDIVDVPAVAFKAHAISRLHRTNGESHCIFDVCRTRPPGTSLQVVSAPAGDAVASA
jgi:hypothetical protein